MCAMQVSAEYVCEEGALLCDEVVQVLTVIAAFVFSYLNFTNRGASGARGCVANKAGFKLKLKLFLCNKYR
jgi:hypothetical protein